MKFQSLLFILCLGLISTPLSAQFLQPRSVTVLNTPTAYTVGRGAYTISLLNYDQGGLECKTLIGIHERIFFGVSLDIERALGSKTPGWNIPGVIAKFALFEGWDYFPAIAVGYDSFYEGSSPLIDHYDSLNNRIKYGPYMAVVSPLYYLYLKERRDPYFEVHNCMIYGPYMAFTSPIYLFNAEQFISYGVRIPIQPVVAPKNASYFFAVDVPLGEFFRIKVELDRVYWDFRTPKEWNVNFGARFTYFKQLSVEFALLYEPGEQLNRILRIEYHGEF